MKRAATMMTCLVLAVFFMAMTSFAQPPVKQSTKALTPKVDASKVKLMLNADPMVETIYAQQCPCAQDLSTVNALLMKDMYVTVFNGVCAGNNKANVSATLKVRYFNLRTQKWDEKNVPITIPANSRKAIKIINGKTLVRKSTGISAEIVNIKAPVKDCNLSNNKVTIMQCSTPPVY